MLKNFVCYNLNLQFTNHTLFKYLSNPKLNRSHLLQVSVILKYSTTQNLLWDTVPAGVSEFRPMILLY